MADVFLSYKREDREIANVIADDLRAEGFSVFFDSNIPVGDIWDEVIDRELDLAQAVVVLWSAEAVTSQWVRNEAREGMRRKILCPVLVAHCKLPTEFSHTQLADLIGRSPGDRDHPEWRNLCAAIARCLGRAPEDASPVPAPALGKLRLAALGAYPPRTQNITALPGTWFSSACFLSDGRIMIAWEDDYRSFWQRLFRGRPAFRGGVLELQGSRSRPIAQMSKPVELVTASPDMNKVVCVDQAGGVYLVSPAGEPRLVARMRGVDTFRPAAAWNAASTALMITPSYGDSLRLSFSTGNRVKAVACRLGRNISYARALESWVFSSQDAIYTVPVDNEPPGAGPVRLITTGNRYNLHHLAVSPDGTRLAASGWSSDPKAERHWLEVWSTGLTPALISQFQSAEPIVLGDDALKWIDDDLILAGTSAGLRIYDAATLDAVWRMNAAVGQCAGWTNDNEIRVAFSFTSDCTVLSWDV